MVALTFCSCAIWSPLSRNDAAAKAQVEKWVPVGTLMADAQHIMEQHRFKCGLNTTGSWKGQRNNVPGAVYLECSFTERDLFTNENWRVALFVENDKVKSVDIDIYEEGP